MSYNYITFNIFSFVGSLIQKSAVIASQKYRLFTLQVAIELYLTF